jgi:hypothetical protein
MVSTDGDGLAFIISAPRSGSTLLSAVLGSHPEALAPPEPWFLLPLVALRDHRLIAMAPFGYQTAEQALHQILPPRLFNKAIKAFAETVYNSLLEIHGAKLFIDKTPPYYQILPTLDEFFPQAKKIWLRRNPLDIIASSKQTYNHQVHDLMGIPSHPSTFHVTVSFVKMIQYFLHTSEDYISVSYEDFVSNQSAVTEQICDFIGINFLPEMIEIYDKPIMRQYANSKVGDKNLIHTRTIHSGSIGRWKAILTPREVELVLKTLGSEIFVTLGYGEQLEEAVRYAGATSSQLTARGRLDILLDTFDRYPRTIYEGVATDPIYGWLEAIHQGKKQIPTLVGEGESFILVDGDEWATDEWISGRRRFRFLERDGQYWGPPADDETAIQELERLRSAGAGHIIFARAAFWWFDHYAGLFQHLESTYGCRLRGEHLVVYELRRGAKTFPVRE